MYEERVVIFKRLSAVVAGGCLKSEEPPGRATARPSSEAAEATVGSTGPTVRHIG